MTDLPCTCVGRPHGCPLAGSAYGKCNARNEALRIRGSARKWSRVWLDFRSLGEFEGIFDLDVEIPDCVLDFGVAQQDLNSAEVTFCLVNDRRFGTPQRMRSLFLRSKSDRHNPFAHEAGILPRAHVTLWVDPARERIIVDRAAAPI